MSKWQNCPGCHRLAPASSCGIIERLASDGCVKTPLRLARVNTRRHGMRTREQRLLGRLYPSSWTRRAVAGHVKARMGFFFVISSLTELGSNLLFSRELDGKIDASPSLQSCGQQVFGLKEKTGNRLERSWMSVLYHHKVASCVLFFLSAGAHFTLKCLFWTLRVWKGGYTPWPCRPEKPAHAHFHAQIGICQYGLERGARPNLSDLVFEINVDSQEKKEEKIWDVRRNSGIYSLILLLDMAPKVYSSNSRLLLILSGVSFNFILRVCSN